MLWDEVCPWGARSSAELGFSGCTTGCKGPLGRCRPSVPPPGPAAGCPALPACGSASPRGDRWPHPLQSTLENKRPKQSWCVPVLL